MLLILELLLFSTACTLVLKYSIRVNICASVIRDCNFGCYGSVRKYNDTKLHCHERHENIDKKDPSVVRRHNVESAL